MRPRIFRRSGIVGSIGRGARRFTHLSQSRSEIVASLI
jgi:hypothetical protein